MTLSATGILFFSMMLASTFADRAVLEKAAVFAVQKKVQAEVKTKYPNLETEGFLQSAEFLRDKFGAKGEAFQKALDAMMDVAVASAVSRFCGCETVSPERQNLVTNFFKSQNVEAVQISEKLGSFIKGKYDTTISGLVRDIRIFSGVNVFAFLLIFLLAWVRPTARFHLFLPAGLLLLSTVLTICLYIFGQNWFYTLMMGSFWGFSYLIYMGVVLGFTLDITLNHGRITSGILNVFSNVTIVPC
ncbi:MAG: hypothetical protein ABJO36_11900 [Litorimonas sp.]